MHLSRRPGEQPSTLLTIFRRFPALHRRVAHLDPQVRGMYAGTASKGCAGGARIPPALRSRQPDPHLLRVRAHDPAGHFRLPRLVPTSKSSEQVVEQVIRPTGLIDPAISVRSARGQIDDLLGEINARVAAGQRALVTTLTKRMAEDLRRLLQGDGNSNPLPPQ